MKVLQLCHRIPFPAKDGGNIAMVSNADALLSQGVELKMLALNTVKHHIEIDSLPAEVRSRYNLEAIPIDTSIRLNDAFANLFSNDSYNVSRFWSNVFERKLAEILKAGAYDVVLLESLFMTPYIPAIRKISSAKIVLRAHNVEHVIWQRLTANETNPVRKFYLGFLAKRMKKVEIRVLNELDGILPITGDDEKIFTSSGSKVPALVIPAGIDTGKHPDQSEGSKPQVLFHIGAMDWRPNIEGVNWFLDECWKPIHQKLPSLKLVLAGRHFPNEIIERRDDDVICEGEVNDAIEFMSGKQLMIVPLKSGGGMRVKIIQGMALGKTIISTSIGAEGVEYSNGKNILIANTPSEFLYSIEKCIADPDYSMTIGKAARKLALEIYSNASIGKKLVDFFRTLQ